MTSFLKRYPAGLLLAFAIALCNMSAYRSSKLVVALFAAELGAGAFDVGMIVSLYALVPFTLAIFAGRLTDRLGMPGPMIAGSIGVILGFLVPWLWPVLPALYVSAAILGGSYVFYHVAIQKLIGAFSTRQTRTEYFATYSLVLASGNFLGPLSSGFAIDAIGHARTYLMLACVPLASITMIVVGRGLLAKEAKGDGHQRGAVMELLGIKSLRRILVTSGVILTGIDLFSFYLPIYGHAIDLSASVIGTIAAMFALASFFVRTIMPRLVQRYGEQGVLTRSLLLSGCTYMLFPFFTNPWLLGVIAFILGMGLGCGQPLSMLLTYAAAPEGRSGEALGLRLTVNHFTHVVTPLIFGAIGTAFGLAPVFWTNAIFLAGGGVINRRRR